MPPSVRRQSIPKPVRVDSSEDRFPEIPNVGSPGRMANDHASFTDEEEDEVIPPNHAHRTLVLCFDGTGEFCLSVAFELRDYLRLLTGCVTAGDQFDDDVGVSYVVLSWRC